MTAAVHFPKSELNGAVDAVTEALRQSRHDLLHIIGVTILNQAQLAYLDKSHGRIGSDGEAWAPIQVATVLARLRRAGHLTSHRIKDKIHPAGVTTFKKQRTIYKVAKSVKRNKELFDALEVAGISFHDKKTGDKIAKGGEKHKRGTWLGVKSSRDLRNEVASGYQIGVDTGLQFSSGSPGFLASDGDGGNVFDQDDVSVTVGYGRVYSFEFDQTRRLMPREMNDDHPWMQALYPVVEKHQGATVETILKARGVD